MYIVYVHCVCTVFKCVHSVCTHCMCIVYVCSTLCTLWIDCTLCIPSVRYFVQCVFIYYAPLVCLVFAVFDDIQRRWNSIIHNHRIVMGLLVSIQHSFIDFHFTTN
eukprot:GHVQ01005489.1.p1 GENE.GHVQ01005489.1~~GHVQ01005489.1.p1  ORF type:complete len:106 (-),score=2.37 GHVQ01005489.1:33-350(-)